MDKNNYDSSMGLHTDDNLFCPENDCPCHEDPNNLETLEGWLTDGLVGVVDATLLYTGRTI